MQTMRGAVSASHDGRGTMRAQFARQAKRQQSNWWQFICGALLLSCLSLCPAGPARAENAEQVLARPADDAKDQDDRNFALRLQEQMPSGKPAASAVPQLVLSAEEASKVGRKIWLNETGGKRDGITSWNPGEAFASLGVGHFIWFPAGQAPPFEESFPYLLTFLRQENAHVPAWLDKTPTPPCPWTSRADFKKNFNSPEMKELRRFLLETMTAQTQFLVLRAQGAMDKILANTTDGAERDHIVAQFSRVTRASKDLYPLIDYINFKGEGTNAAETSVDPQTGRRQGWGLKQVLLAMNGSTTEPKAVLAEFAEAARQVLHERVVNQPASRIWEAGWQRRVDTYRRPIADQGPEFRRRPALPLQARHRQVVLLKR